MTQDELGIRPPAATSVPSLHTAAVSHAAHGAGAAAAEKSNADIEKSKLADAAKKFEALLLAQILKSATPEEGEGLLSGTGDSSSQSIYQLALENFASVLSLQGGLGLAESVASELKPHGVNTSIHG
jgi:Rod binding domain-containing protein